MIHPNIFPQWLSAGIICLLVGGTLAAKTVFLVDNELEQQSELNGENWLQDFSGTQTDAQGIRKLAYKYIDRLTQLPAQKAWCGSAQEISLVLAKAKSLHLIEVNNLTRGNADIIVKLPKNQMIQSSQQQPKNLYLYVNPEPVSNSSQESWCIAAGSKKR